MRNKLFYLVGAAFLVCSISTFTSCSSNEEDPEIEFPGGGGGEGEDRLDLAGKYSSVDDNTLEMYYNEEILTGKRVTFTPDEDYKKATIILDGVEKDLSSMILGLADFKLQTYSPIPGEKTITLKDVELTPNKDGTVYTFKGQDAKPTRTMVYEGVVQKGEMTIKITNTLANNELAGKWDLAPVKYNDKHINTAPFWMDWNTEVAIDPGELKFGETVVSNLDQNPNAIFTLLNLVADPSMAEIMGFSIEIEQMIANLLQSVTAEPNGSMFATYSYSGDLNNPLWSSEMNHNIIHYYQGEEVDRLYVEVNTDFILNAIGGLLGTRAAGNRETEAPIQQLVNALIPVLERGFPCTYEITGNKMRLSLDGEFTLDILRKLVTILNDPTINSLVMSLLEGDPTLAPYAPNVKTLLKSLPPALTYFKGDSEKNYTGECKYIKLGFHLEKAAE